VSAAGWRWIFLINIPVGLIVIVAALRVLPADSPRGGGAGASWRGFDLGGAVSVTAGASLLAYAVAQTSSHAWVSTRTVGLLCAAAALAGYFVVHEAREERVGRTPLMPLSLWRNRSVAGANIVSALLASAMFAVFYSTTLYMQQVLHYSALRTGLAGRLSAVDEYAEVFDPYKDTSCLPFRISDDIAAVVADLIHGLKHYQAGRSLEALWWWQYSYFNHWGTHGGAALRALHAVVAHASLDVAEESTSP